MRGDALRHPVNYSLLRIIPPDSAENCASQQVRTSMTLVSGRTLAGRQLVLGAGSWFGASLLHEWSEGHPSAALHFTYPAPSPSIAGDSVEGAL
jgi:hypothetical protein